MNTYTTEFCKYLEIVYCFQQNKDSKHEYRVTEKEKTHILRKFQSEVQDFKEVQYKGSYSIRRNIFLGIDTFISEKDESIFFLYV